MSSFYVWTIGCQMNKADSRVASEELMGLGYHPVERAWDADLVILNTCVVRQSAEDRAMGFLSSLKPLKRYAPDARLVVMGCLVGDETLGELRHRFPYVDAWLRPSNVQGLLDFIQGDTVPDQLAACKLRPATPVSTFVPVTYGCDHFCTYCIVRLRRGRERSRPDEMLRRMGRGYTVAQYRALIERIRARIPMVSLATDVIVGFPGETEAQFENTLQLLDELRFDMVHVAAYSERPGTPAARLPDDVAPAEKERRRQSVEARQECIAGEINRELVGQTVEVLVEQRRKGRWQGRTRTSKLTFFEDETNWRGRLAQVRITWAGPWSLIGELS